MNTRRSGNGRKPPFDLSLLLLATCKQAATLRRCNLQASCNVVRLLRNADERSFRFRLDACWDLSCHVPAAGSPLNVALTAAQSSRGPTRVTS
ncbi:hypothetical protein PR003_g22150 [Phytophthora rubi]|uniref:Uncharacterized protein n=1 Tax=Phytophthora rubi TaxID=129364 RepID=A0A6A4DAI2_9STRA|nr:hypothetical protein PR002_g25538 [Phytophthora rubi]KAE8992307.1 hypothetical protein PR001_g20980 [Phytophthora rubi]KAE9302862.1 hypothetical protein PR003_g22150 [Phytophthora rubi]